MSKLQLTSAFICFTNCFPQSPAVVFSVCSSFVSPHLPLFSSSSVSRQCVVSILFSTDSSSSSSSLRPVWSPSIGHSGTDKCFMNTCQTNPTTGYIPVPVLIRLICLHELLWLSIPVVINKPIHSRELADGSHYEVHQSVRWVLALLELEPGDRSVVHPSYMDRTNIFSPTCRKCNAESLQYKTSTCIFDEPGEINQNIFPAMTEMWLSLGASLYILTVIVLLESETRVSA